MPLYEFKCQTCGHVFEHLSRRASDLPDECPECGASGPKKLLSSFNARDSGPPAAGGSSSCPTGTCPTGTCSLN